MTTPEEKFRRLRNLIILKQHNDSVKRVLQDVDPKNLVDSTGRTLLHIAADCGNIGAVSMLLKKGIDINSRDLTGKTPLLTAALNRELRIVGLLLDNNADILCPDNEGQSVLNALVTYRTDHTPIGVLLNYFRRLERRLGSVYDIAEVLVNEKCPPMLILAMKNARVLGAVLDLKDSMGLLDNICLIMEAMKSPYRENVRAILKHGIAQHRRNELFIVELEKLMEEDLPAAKSLLDDFASWDFVPGALEVFIKNTFRKGTANAIQMILSSTIYDYFKVKLKYELIAHAYGNHRLNVIEMLQTNRFNIHVRGKNGWSALHFAAWDELRTHVRYLLDRGLDPDVEDDSGATAIEYLRGSNRCAVILLVYGARIQYVANNGDTLFELIKCMEFLEYGLAHVVALEMAGKPIKPRIHEYIQNDRRLGDYTNTFRDQCEWMKRQIILGPINFFMALHMDIPRLAEYVPDQQVVTNIFASCRDFRLTPYYYKVLEVKLNKALLARNLKCTAVRFLTEYLDLREHIQVVENIVSHFTYAELLKYE